MTISSTRTALATATSQVLYKGLSGEITITDNAIIPLKERVVDEHFDPLRKLFRIFSR